MKRNESSVRRQVVATIPHFKLCVFTSFALALLVQLVALVPPMLMEYLMDVAVPAGNVRSILTALLWFCLLPLISTSFQALYRYFLAMAGRKMGCKLFMDGFEKLLEQPVSYFERENSAELASYCRSEAMEYVMFWLFDLPTLFASLAGGLVIFAYLLHIHWVIALWMLLYFPVSYFPSNFFANKVRDLSRRIVSYNAQMNQVVADTLRGIKFVKSMVLEQTQSQKLRLLNQESLGIWGQNAVLENLAGLWINDFSNTIFTGVAFGVAALLIVKGEMTLGNLVILTRYSGRFFTVARKAMTTNYHFKSQLGKFDRLFEILTLESKEPEGTKEFSFDRRIQLQDLSFAYQKERGNVLKGLTLTIEKGEWLGIVGENGAGKSTLFDLLLGMYQPQQGSITVDGQALEAFSKASLRRHIAKVSQETFLFPGTLEENLRLAAPEATEQQLYEVLDLVRLGDFVRELPKGLQTDVGEAGQLLSGGQRQRLGLAQGLLRGAEVLLLDEVTANVDEKIQQELRVAIGEVRRHRHLTVVAISHRAAFLQDADRVVTLQDGVIVP